MQIEETGKVSAEVQPQQIVVKIGELHVAVDVKAARKLIDELKYALMLIDNPL